MKQQTRLVHLGRPKRSEWPAPVNPPVHRASTVTFPTLESYQSVFSAPYGTYSYGRDGTPTIFAFEQAMAHLEGGDAALAMPSGVAAIVSSILALAKSGDHILFPDSMYGSARAFCKRQLPRLGIDHSFYRPRASATEVEAAIQPNTRALYIESPGSITLEVADVPALVDVARARGIATIMDNTWATPLLFPAVAKGVDISIHAATKYIIGHSDAMLGVVVTKKHHFEALRQTQSDYGYVAGSEEAYLGLRGLRTLDVRLRRHQQNALKLAEHLQTRPEIESVLYPALPDSRDHALWRRDFSGACGLFSAVVASDFLPVLEYFVDSLRHFAIGASWGGFESLVTVHNPGRSRSFADWSEKTILRFHVGLEDADDLISDVDRAFEVARKQS